MFNRCLAKVVCRIHVSSMQEKELRLECLAIFCCYVHWCRTFFLLSRFPRLKFHIIFKKIYGFYVYGIHKVSNRNLNVFYLWTCRKNRHGSDSLSDEPRLLAVTTFTNNPHFNFIYMLYGLSLWHTGWKKFGSAPVASSLSVVSSALVRTVECNSWFLTSKGSEVGR